MIQEIEISNFKSFKNVKLKLGTFNLFVGANASGKSNFFDALRVLQGIGYGFTVDEILNGKPKSAGAESWDPIRGGSTMACYAGNNSIRRTKKSDEILFRVQSEFLERFFSCSLGILPESGCVCRESLFLNGVEIYSSDGIPNLISDPAFTVKYNSRPRGRKPHFQFQKSKSVLHQIKNNSRLEPQKREVTEACIQILSNMQKIDPSPAILREYAHTQKIDRMGERGENFAALINTIVRNKETKAAYLSWLQQLIPSELDDVKILKGALEEPLFAIREGKRYFAAPVLSDGTLRFAAITAAFFQPDLPLLLGIEEIENGIHASRLRLLLELLKTQSSERMQVMATTHSPVVLSWLDESDYATTFFCKRNEETGETTITPLKDIPR